MAVVVGGGRVVLDPDEHNLLVGNVGGVHGVLHRRDGSARRHGIPEVEHEEGDHGAARGREEQGHGGPPGAVMTVGAVGRRRGEQAGGVERLGVHPVGSGVEGPAEEGAVAGGCPEAGEDGPPEEDGGQIERAGEQRRGRVVVDGGRGGEADVERGGGGVVVYPGVAGGGGSGSGGIVGLAGGAAGEVDADAVLGEDDGEGRGLVGGGGGREEEG